MTARTRKRNATADAAQAYLDKGLRVVPMRRGAKVPALGGFGAEFPEYSAAPADFGARDGVAVLCGPCPALGATADDPEAGDWLMCVDLDGGLKRKGGAKALGAGLPPTLATHDGAHLWYRVTPSRERGELRQWGGLLGVRKQWKAERREGKAPDIDLKWCGGYARELDDPDAFEADQISELPIETVRAILAAPGAHKSTGEAEAAPECSDRIEPDVRDALVSALVTEWPDAGAGRHDAAKALGGALRREGVGRADTEAIAAGVMQGARSDAPETRVAAALNAWDRVNRGDSAFGKPTLRTLLVNDGRKTMAALESLPPPPPDPWWCGYADHNIERLRRGERVSAFARAVLAWARPEISVVTDGAEAAVVHAEQDATGLHLHPRTGWPWILQKKDSFWFHRPDAGCYRDQEYASSELIASVGRDLAGLVSSDDRSLDKLRDKWIRPIRALRSTYTARAHTYDPETRTLTLAALRWTERKAKRHAHIDRWLRALFGAGYDATAQWLAALIVLDRPAPCLYLPGPRRLGKSLLADGLAALWSRPAPVDMRDAIKDFNQSTGECPLIFTDEGFPEGLDFNAFKKMITAHSRSVNAKFRAPVDVEGCGRFMIAANDEDALRYQRIGTLTKDSLEAIADRLLVVHCHREAEGEVKRFDTTAAAQGEIAEHVLWLSQTVELEPRNERMAAKSGGGERILANVVAGRSAEILARIREAIGTGAMGEKSGVLVPKRAAKSEVWINVARLHETLTGRVALAAVKEVCDSLQLRPGVEQRSTADGHNLKWRVLDRVRLDEAFAGLD